MKLLRKALKRSILIGILCTSGCALETPVQDTQPKSKAPEILAPSVVTDVKLASPKPSTGVKELSLVRNQWVWSVQKDAGPKSYLVGSVHAPFAKDYEPPKAFWDIFSQVETFYMEADITQTEDVSRLTLALGFDAAQDSKALIGPELWPVLLERMKPLNIKEEVIVKMNPWYLNILLAAASSATTVTPATPEDIGQVMDLRLKTFAEKQGLKIDFLENPAAQLAQLVKIPSSEYIRLIKANLSESSTEAKAEFKSIFDAYNQGDEAGFASIEADTFKESALSHRYVLVERNQNWLKILEGILPQKSIILVAGNLHMAGDQGLVLQLRARGYKVERLQF